MTLWDHQCIAISRDLSDLLIKFLTSESDHIIQCEKGNIKKKIRPLRKKLSDAP